jgi:hypothetical protein
VTEIFDKRTRIKRFGTEPESVTTPVDDDGGHRLRWIENRILILSGEDGTNGKLGNLAKKVDGHGALLKAIGGAALTGIAAAATALYTAGLRSGAREQEIEFLRAEVAALRAEARDLRAERPVYPRYAPAPPTPGDLP